LRTAERLVIFAAIALISAFANGRMVKIFSFGHSANGEMTAQVRFITPRTAK
jgi:hypothetical protein